MKCSPITIKVVSLAVLDEAMLASAAELESKSSSSMATGSLFSFGLLDNTMELIITSKKNDAGSAKNVESTCGCGCCDLSRSCVSSGALRWDV